MKELKILAVVVFFTLITYIGVEPFAHSQMHEHIEPVDYKYSDLKPLNKKGDPKKGAETFMNAGCIGCHGVKSQGMAAPMDPVSASASFGVVPPDLSTAGALYDETFLANLIKNPAHALMLEHKFNESKPHPMTPFMGLGGDLDQEVADIVAYLKSIAPKKLDDKEAFIDACGRCHNVKYDKWTVIGEKPKLESEKAKAEFNLKLATYEENLKKYLGTTPPDLSIIVRAKSEEHLMNFMGEPQRVLHGTAMPRVGITKENAEKVIAYLEKVGDRKKDERNSLTLKIIIFFIIFSIFAYLWKASKWREVH